jgi:hypothetical protein
MCFSSKTFTIALTLKVVAQRKDRPLDIYDQKPKVLHLKINWVKVQFCLLCAV